MPKRNSFYKEPQVEDDRIRFSFEPFQPDNEDWSYYRQRFEVEIELGGSQVKNKKKELLLARVGATAFKVLVDHFRPAPVTSQSYEQLTQVLDSYYGKAYCSLGERVTFTHRIRNDGETVAHFINELRALAGHCNFGQSLEERLRDQFVIGINNPTWQKEILRRHPDVECSFKEVEATAKTLEKADETHDRLNTTQAEAAAYKVTRQGKTRPKGKPTILLINKNCFKCGGMLHSYPERCPAEGKKCNECNERNHFAKACIKSGRAQIKKENKQSVHRVKKDASRESVNSDTSDDMGSSVRTLAKGQQVMLKININDVVLDMLYDPGAAESVISVKTWKKIGSPKLTPTGDLIAYTGIPVETVGKAMVTVRAFKQKLQLPLTVVRGHDIPLFGLQWVLKFGLPLPPGSRICKINKVNTTLDTDKNKNDAITHNKNRLKDTTVNNFYTNNLDENELDQLLKNFSAVFSSSLGTIRGHKAVIHLRDDAQPKIFKPRPVPFSLRSAVEEEIQRLVVSGVLEPVDPTVDPVLWASPVVVVLKPTGKLRICGDFKVTINKFIHGNQHPLPRFEEIAAKLQGGTEFSTLDLKDAYLQMTVDESSRKYLVIATHLGYFRYCRLPFGVCFAPGLFQQTMDSILLGIDNVACYLDDIIITAKSKKEHFEKLRIVLGRLAQAGIHVEKAKCKFLQKSVQYLGHRIDSEGIHPMPERLEAIKNMPIPNNISELRSFLGSINYYQKFIKSLQSICSPLHRHLKKGKRWHWTENDTKIVTELKNILSSSDTLVHFNSDLPLILDTDASEKGLGAVLSHKFPNGSIKPIAYASRSISGAEKRYSVVDREALGVVYAVTKFRQYLYGRKFLLRTDHKPLIRLFGEHNELPKLSSDRLARWALILSAYSYEIQYLSGKNNAPADLLSRLPLPETDENVNTKEFGKSVFRLKLEDLNVTFKDLQREISSDKSCRQVISYLELGWPDQKNIDANLMTYFGKKDELSYEKGILLWKGRIVIPKTLQKKILGMLHEGHPGVVAMRSFAKFHVWWPKMDRQIEEHVKLCRACQERRNVDPLTPLHSWSVPDEPWSRIHIDYAGPMEGYYWLVVADATTKWLEVVPVKKTTSEKTIAILQNTFARFGVPKIIVSDNGPQFTSSQFNDFCRTNGVRHVTSSPYHPKTNGLAERAVQTFKRRFKATKSEGGSLELRVAKTLMAYRAVPHRTTGRSPAELMFGRPLRTKFTLMKPDLSRDIESALITQKKYHDRTTKKKEFKEGEKIWFKQQKNKQFEEGTVIACTGPLSYVVQVHGVQHRCHAEHLRKRLQQQEED